MRAVGGSCPAAEACAVIVNASLGEGGGSSAWSRRANPGIDALGRHTIGTPFGLDGQTSSIVDQARRRRTRAKRLQRLSGRMEYRLGAQSEDMANPAVPFDAHTTFLFHPLPPRS